MYLQAMRQDLVGMRRTTGSNMCPEIRQVPGRIWVYIEQQRFSPADITADSETRQRLSQLTRGDDPACAMLRPILTPIVEQNFKQLWHPRGQRLAIHPPINSYAICLHKHFVFCPSLLFRMLVLSPLDSSTSSQAVPRDTK
jgi:hypothetical protein